MNYSYVEKIYKVIDLINENHPCFNIKYSEEYIYDFVKKSLNNYKLDNEYDFYYLSNLIIKEILEPYDSHTSLTPLNCEFFWLPFQCTIIDKYPVINLTSKKFCKYKGYKIKNINGIDIGIIMEEMAKITICNNDSLLKKKIEWYLSGFFFLKCLPSLRNMNNIIKFSLENNKKKTELILDISKDHDQHLEGYVPIKNYSFEYINSDAIIIHFTRCRDNNKEIEKLINLLKENENSISWYILDLRGNSGGNSDVFMPLLDFLKDKKTITLVDYKVFSGGIWAAQYMSDIGSIIIGESVGDTINNFADKRFFEIDNNFRLDISYKYFYFDNHKFNIIEGKDEFTSFYKNKKNKKWLNPCYLKIDYKIDYSKNNYLDIINNIINK